MIRILSISASPVEQSSTDLILKWVADSIAKNIGDQSELQTTSVRLNELKFIPCQSCGKAPTPEFCFFDDDLTDVYAELAVCDCLLFGSPVYFDTVSAQAKMFIDRCNCFRPPDFDNVDPRHDFIPLLRRESPGVIVLVGGERGWFEGARRVMAGFFKWLDISNEGMVLYRSPGFTQCGAAGSDPVVKKDAEQLGHRLAELILSKEHERSQTD